MIEKAGGRKKNRGFSSSLSDPALRLSRFLSESLGLATKKIAVPFVKVVSTSFNHTFTPIV